MTSKPPKKYKINQETRRYNFFLNPYTDARFTRCPQCNAPTKVRKRVFVIHIEPRQLLNLNMSGRYCPDCDLMILHQDVVEDLIARTFTTLNPDIIGNDYLIMGTLDRKIWLAVQEDPHSYDLVFDNLHVFKNVVKFEPEHYGWVPDPAKQKDKPE